eukprot:4425151-Prymnesium_polylepis.2
MTADTVRRTHLREHGVMGALRVRHELEQADVVVHRRRVVAWVADGLVDEDALRARVLLAHGHVQVVPVDVDRVPARRVRVVGIDDAVGGGQCVPRADQSRSAEVSVDDTGAIRVAQKRKRPRKAERCGFRAADDAQFSRC